MQKVQLEEITKEHLGNYCKIFAINECETEQIQVWERRDLPHFYHSNQPAILNVPLDLYVKVQDLKKIDPLINRLCELDPLGDQRICQTLMNQISITNETRE